MEEYPWTSFMTSFLLTVIGKTIQLMGKYGILESIGISDLTAQMAIGR